MWATRDFLSQFCFLFHCPLDGKQFTSVQYKEPAFPIAVCFQLLLRNNGIMNV